MTHLKPSILFLVVGLLAGCRAPQTATAEESKPPEADTAVVKSLPLERGYFVREGTPCGEASNATLTLHTGSGINVARVACSFTRIEKTGDDTYNATEECQSVRGDSFTEIIHFTIASRTTYSSVRGEAGEDSRWSARHCPQSSLPEPWRSNDISRYLE